MNIVRIGCAVVLALGICAPASATSVFINEIHYDNSSTDVGEFVEIAGPAGTDLTGWSIALYNGSSSQLNVYDTIALSGTLTNSANGFGFAAFLRSGIQNGAPDGLALIDASSNVVQFLSYEGVFTAGSGPATGLMSTDIGVEEPGAAGESLQLTGTGNEYEDFTWSGPVAETPDAVNNGQSFGGTPPPTPSDVLINEFLVKPASNSAGDAGHALRAEPGRERGRGTVIGRLGDIGAQHQPARGRRQSLQILVVGADIADVRESKGDDLPGIAGIGEDLLISGNRCVEADFADCLARGADAVTPQDSAVAQNQSRRGPVRLSGVRRCGVWHEPVLQGYLAGGRCGARVGACIVGPGTNRRGP